MTNVNNHPSISRNKLSAVCRKFHIKKMAFFGSSIRGELKPESDLDILVEFEPAHTPGLIKLAHIQNHLSKLLGRPVDLRTPQDLSPYFREEVLSKAQVQYEQK